MKWPLLLTLLCVPLVFAAYTPPSNTAVDIVLSTGYTPADYQNVIIIIGSIPSTGNVTPANNSCTFTSGTWTVQCSDACNLSTNTATSGTVIFNGTGTVIVTANITGVTSCTVQNGCSVTVSNGGRIGKN